MPMRTLSDNFQKYQDSDSPLAQTMRPWNCGLSMALHYKHLEVTWALCSLLKHLSQGRSFPEVMTVRWESGTHKMVAASSPSNFQEPFGLLTKTLLEIWLSALKIIKLEPLLVIHKELIPEKISRLLKRKSRLRLTVPIYHSLLRLQMSVNRPRSKEKERVTFRCSRKMESQLLTCGKLLKRNGNT